MPILDDARYEKFANALVGGRTTISAYVHAGFKRNYSAAAKLRKKPQVVARIAELQHEAAKLAILDAGISKQWVIECLRETVVHFLTNKNPNATSNRALELIGKEIGMFVERQERGKPGDFEHLSDQELEAQLTQRLKARGIPDRYIRNFFAAPHPMPANSDGAGGEAALKINRRFEIKDTPLR